MKILCAMFHSVTAPGNNAIAQMSASEQADEHFCAFVCI